MTITKIRPVRGRRDRYTVELTWAQVEALRDATHFGLYGYGPTGNKNALRHALRKLKGLRYRPRRDQLP